MRKTRTALKILLFPLLLTPALDAQTPDDPTFFTFSAMVGLGGSFDVEPDAGFDNGSLQLGFSFPTESNVLVGFRLGRLELGGSRGFGPFDDADLTYLTVAGEYRFQESYYESGLYFGLGVYDLDPVGGEGDAAETDLGVTLGVTGEFDINRRFDVLIELAAHYAPGFEEANLFGTLHAGLAVHF